MSNMNYHERLKVLGTIEFRKKRNMYGNICLTANKTT